MPYSSRVSRREFLRIVGLTASAAALGACASPTPTSQPAQPTSTKIPPTETSTIPATNTPTAVPPTATTSPPRAPIFPEMVLVEPGRFRMGSEEGYPKERPVHRVRITRPFYIGIYAVTYGEYAAYCDTKPDCQLQKDDPGLSAHPVSGVDWFNAVAYCNWLSRISGLTLCYSGKGKVTQCDFSADGYRLPTEAEWEYAARGGHLSQGFLYSGSDDPDEVAWYNANSGGTSHPVGQKKPNELGLYDMSGNQWEWCWDWHSQDYYASSPKDDPTGPTDIPPGPFVERSRRSGSAIEGVSVLRPAFRSADYDYYEGDNGLRLVRTA